MKIKNKNCQNYMTVKRRLFDLSCTFTLSNLGMFGVDRFDAILPPGTHEMVMVPSLYRTFTLSNLGMFGVDRFDAILPPGTVRCNHGCCSILALCSCYKGRSDWHEKSDAGTFTLSNLGMFGVDRFDAILPPGTGAIMAVVVS
ncbi:unnamed protein product [Ilex paraguariensis]|uniref:2-oxoacid dehydrogenase acyltransferase catalytic domain-containing protein n=1 Tax=Ilex paraguariensis TaxID=185542 RepID=A0ABC8S013_9AQUA